MGGGEGDTALMEMVAAAVGLLTIYDMGKAADRGMRIDGVRLHAKSGGKSGHFRAAGDR